MARARPTANRTSTLPRSPQTLQRAITALPPTVPPPAPVPGADPLLFPLGNPGGVQGNALAGIDWILNPSIDFNETDTIAAEQAVGGGFSGSGFAGNNQMRLRDSERMKRIALGNELLQPYLERSAASARQQISEAGLDRRLGSELANRLQLALINGDQQESETLLREAGMDRRQSAQIAGQLQNTQLSVQSDLLRTLIGAGAGGGGGSGGRVAPPGTNNISTGGGGGGMNWAQAEAVNPFSNISSSGQSAFNPAARGIRSGGGSNSQYSSYINQILQGYGL